MVGGLGGGGYSYGINMASGCNEPDMQNLDLYTFVVALWESSVLCTLGSSPVP